MAGSISHIHARNAALYVDSAAITFDASTSLDQEQGGATIFKVKNVIVTPPSNELDKTDLWGEDSLDTLGSNVSATGTFQIQAIERKSISLGRVRFTLVLSHDEAGSTTPNAESLEVLFHGASQIDIVDNPAFTRSVYGDSTASPPISVGNLGFVFNNGAGIVNVNMNRVEVSPTADIRPTGADGHWEQEMEAVCLAQDFVIERQD